MPNNDWSDALINTAFDTWKKHYKQLILDGESRAIKFDGYELFDTDDGPTEDDGLTPEKYGQKLMEEAIKAEEEKERTKKEARKLMGDWRRLEEAYYHT